MLDGRRLFLWPFITLLLTEVSDVRRNSFTGGSDIGYMITIE